MPISAVYGTRRIFSSLKEEWNMSQVLLQDMLIVDLDIGGVLS